MLDHRIYRAAFVPAVVVLVLAAFSLGDPAGPRTTRVAPDAFDGARAFGARVNPAPESLTALAGAFPSRRPGSDGDAGVARRVTGALQRSGFAARGEVRVLDHRGDTIDGERDLRLVMAERQGLSSRRVLVVATRDAIRPPGLAELSGTAVLLELARVLADRDLRTSVVLASASGGTGGHAGVREAVRRAGGRLDAVLVLGDLASERPRRPWVVPWANAGPPAPHRLRRTVEAALRAETGTGPGTVRAIAQWARRAVPVSVAGQGAAGAAGAPAVLVSASGELGPAPGAPVTRGRLTAFGRGVLRAFTAIEAAQVAGGGAAFADEGGIVTFGRRLPDWAVRLLVGALLLPAVLTAIDAYFRARRRRLAVERWALWTVSWMLPFLLAWGWLRLLDVAGGADALPAPGPPGAAPLAGAPTLALGSVVLVAVLGFAGVRPLLARRIRPPGDLAAGGAAAAIGLLTVVLVALVWLRNPYAAAVLLPAAHVWLIAPAPESRAGRGTLAAALAAGLLGPFLLALYFAATLDLAAGEALRLVFDLVAGGQTGLLDALALSALLGLAIALALVLARRRRVAASAPVERPRTRGPVSYAGPGSLGGTDSALRR